MPLLKPDPTFYPSPGLAAQSPPEKLAYLTLISPGTHRQSDAIGVVDVDPASKSYGEQFYPDGVRGWMAKVNVRPEGGMELDSRFFLEFDGMRPHQVRLQGGDASSDSYCYA